MSDKASSSILDMGDENLIFENFDNAATHSDFDSESLNEKKPFLSSSSSSIWTLDYYRQFFDVDTSDVLQRLLWSLLPTKVSFLESQFRSSGSSSPDLYGPFWISVTLVFISAIAGNLSSYLNSSSVSWHYDFHKVTLSAFLVFGYGTFLPTALHSFLWWRRGSSLSDQGEESISSSSQHLSLLEILSLYGYSLSIFIPISLLWLIRISALQWTLAFFGAFFSGFVLLHSLRNTLESSLKSSSSFLLILFVLAFLHLTLSFSFMISFFSHVSSESLGSSAGSPSLNTT